MLKNLEKNKAEVEKEIKAEASAPRREIQKESPKILLPAGKKSVADKRYVMILFFAVIFVLGFLFGFAQNLGSSKLLCQSDISKLQAQLDKAKRFFPVVSEMYSISGKVVKVGENTITVDVPASSNPFDEYPITREVAIGENTKTVKRVLKDFDVFQAEMADYQRLQASGPQASAPVPYKEEGIILADLKTGDTVTVESNQNIKNLVNFEALKIVFQEQFGPEPLPAN